MEKFRLAVFNTQPPHLYMGGVERRINETMSRLAHYADITVYSGTKAGFKKPLNRQGINFVPLFSTSKVYPLDNWTFNRTVTKTVFNANIYEAHNDSGYGLLKTLKKPSTARKAFVHTIHGVLADEFEQAKLSDNFSFKDKIANHFMAKLARLEERTAKEADLIVTISQYSFEKLQKHYNKIDPTKVRIVSNGVDLQRYKPAENPMLLKQKFGLTEAPVVLFVGNLIPRKGVMYLAKVAKEIIKTEPYVQFVIIGRGPLKDMLIRRLKSDNLLDNFIFKSNLTDENLSALYSCSDVFALPSLQEGQGIVLLEAAASGKPVVAFNIGGVNEVVLEGKTGLLTRRGNCAEFTEALLKLLGNASLRQNMGLTGRRFVGENFTWDICTQKMLKIYQEARHCVV
ncbi:MAG: glycosyltransferase family 4 protein [Candidatus Bathyarchaeota archaeon]|uniref:glycosyltransferase family 4 protein n=1 Tax=Candidatus Bathycorpusculum sp. TaxID=2994959 RepID=UPI0028247D56|nr:glycosyltransferase family 4 protein [Candidatus Termiticorpusculum sp.]MCL2258166.1 glycosyltransferase family 4 protein [Candidatus Termiticorpusculum sp.]MCL2291513.1 glycosyltransferase family 4 protein [Candidatus Termiticorpusculum sp.]